MIEQNRAVLIASLLTVASIATAIVCVYARHESRKLFTHLQHLTSERDALEVEWGQLQIEQSTWSTHSRVEEKAIHCPSGDQLGCQSTKGWFVRLA